MPQTADTTNIAASMGIWNMKLYHFEAIDVHKKAGYRFVTVDELVAQVEGTVHIQQEQPLF